MSSSTTIACATPTTSTPPPAGAPEMPDLPASLKLTKEQRRESWKGRKATKPKADKALNLKEPKGGIEPAGRQILKDQEKEKAMRDQAKRQAKAESKEAHLRALRETNAARARANKPLPRSAVKAAVAKAEAKVVPIKRVEAAQPPAEAEKDIRPRFLQPDEPPAPEKTPKKRPGKAKGASKAKAAPKAPKTAKAAPKAPPKARRGSDGPSGKSAECLKLAARPKGASRAELVELTGWTGAPWKWLFENSKGNGWCQRFGYKLTVADKDGEVRYHVVKK